MQIKTQEHYDLMAHFEKAFRGVARLDREEKTEWSKCQIYQNDQINQLFLAYRKGYALGKTAA